MEKTITMSLTEYNKLISDNKAFISKKENEGAILISRQTHYCGPGGIQYEFTIHTKDKVIENLISTLNDLAESNAKIYQDFCELKAKEITKKGFW